MKKKYFISFITILLLGITVLGFNFYDAKKVEVSKIKVLDWKTEPFYGLNLRSVVLKGDENGDPLNGVTFKIKSPDEEFVYTLHQGSSAPSPRSGSDSYYDGVYNLLKWEELSEEDLYSFLTEEQHNTLMDIRTEGDFNEVEDAFKFCGISSYYDVNGNEYFYRYCNVVYPTVFILEETRVPAGYGKKKVLVPGLVVADFEYSLGTNGEPSADTEFDYGSIQAYNIMNGYSMEYGTVDINSLIGNDIEAIVNTWKTKGTYNNYCEPNTPSPWEEILRTRDFGWYEDEVDSKASGKNMEVLQKVGMNQSEIDAFYNEENECPIYIQNTGSVKLEVSHYVNNAETITTNVNQQLEYKVVVKNTGDVDAINNKVVAKLPQGFVYVEGSVSNNGVYDHGTITWDISRINKGDNVTLYYKAYAPKGISTNTSYIGEASVENTSMEQGRVEANKTYVKLSLVNPYTYAPIGLIFLVLLLTAGVLVVVLRVQKKEK